MNRNLVNTACVIATIVFLATFAYEFSRPGVARGARGSGVSLPPVEAALASYTRAHRRLPLPHDVWSRTADALLRAPDPVIAFTEFTSHLTDQHQRDDAAGGYAGYYLGYTLMVQEREPEAERVWELALANFQEWAHAERPRHAHNDTVYLARTLMRLGRDSEAYEAIRAVPGVEHGEPVSDTAAILLARTLAEIGRSRRAAELLDDALARPRADTDFLRNVVLGSLRWSVTGEPQAMRVAQNAGARALAPLLRESTDGDIALFRMGRESALVQRGWGNEDRASSLLRAGAAAAGRVEPATENSSYWRARFLALTGDAAAAAGEIASAPAGMHDPNRLTSNHDLAPLMGREDMRAAVLRHGEPVAWPEPDSEPDPDS